MTFSQAKSVCEDKGAFLPEPRTEAMRNLMRQSLDFPKLFYLGLTYIADKRQYVWATDNATVSNFDWKDGHPRGRKSDDCVRRGPDGWCDRSCLKGYYIVCQKRE